MTVGIVAVVEYDEHRGMWCVTLYQNGTWIEEQWFYTELTARQWAAVAEARS